MFMKSVSVLDIGIMSLEYSVADVTRIAREVRQVFGLDMADNVTPFNRLKVASFNITE